MITKAAEKTMQINAPNQFYKALPKGQQLAASATIIAACGNIPKNLSRRKDDNEDRNQTNGGDAQGVRQGGFCHSRTEKVSNP